MSLLTDGNSVSKIKKSNDAKLGYLTAILYLAPFKTSGLGNVCPHASKGCISSCLFTAGRGAMSNVQAGRIRKTRLWYEQRDDFINMLYDDIDKFIRKCNKLGMKPAIRLNGTSDISWEKYLDLDKYPHVQFYDYTKNSIRMSRYLDGSLPPNYHLTFSRSENNEIESIEHRRRGGNIAVVFEKELPTRWNRFKVFSGDKHDLRFLDPKRGVCGLTAKGKAKKDKTGFVVRP